MTNLPPLSRRFLLAAAALALAPTMASAQSWPTAKPIRIVVAYPAGGVSDNVARALADKLAVQLGTPVVIENKAGASGSLGVDAVAKAAPDGYTLLMSVISGLSISPTLYGGGDFDPIADFIHVSIASRNPSVLVVNPAFAAKTFGEYVAYAKANPGKLTYASAGNGSGQHVLAAALWSQAGVDIVHVPYRGAQPAYADLLGDRVDLFFDLTPTTRAHVETGKLKAIAVSSAARNPMQPGVQTINESGVVKLDLESWFGFFAPARTPPEVLARLRTELATIIATPELQDTFRKAGGSPMNISVADTRTMLARDVQRWTGLIRAANISLD